MPRAHILKSAVLVLTSCLAGGWIPAQSPNDPFLPPAWPQPIPPPEEPAEKDQKQQGEAEEEEGSPEQFLPEGRGPWEVPPEMLGKLADSAGDYWDYALRFTCLETIRAARYRNGEASTEETRRYEYILESDRSEFVPRGDELKEHRQRIKRGGKLAPINKALDEELRFPPAYGWAFLFSEFNQSYFMYRDLGDRFNGFDWVKDIQFRGTLPWNGGKDIREWEGLAVVDLSSHTPVEIRAIPSGQREKIRAMYNEWSRAFRILGARLAPTPLGYRCRILFNVRKDGLTFPSVLRYDVFRAIRPESFVFTQAYIHEYDGYRFFKTKTQEALGDPVP